MASLLDHSMSLGVRRARLEVRVSNSAALELYLKYGFEIVSQRKRYYTDNDEDAYIMTTPSFETAAFQTNLDRRRRQLHARLKARDTNSTPQGHAPGLAQDRQAFTARDQRAG